MISDELEKKLEELKTEMKDPTPTEKEKKMETQTETTTKRKPPMKKAAAPKAPAKKKAAAPKAKAKGDDEGGVTLKDIAKEAKLEPRIARRKLRKAGIGAEGRYSWKEGSSDLKKAREALAADEE